MMQAVWAENFVEDGNLTFTISLLRKALEDNPQNPRFIKTVPLHGYKFIADVKNSAEEITEKEPGLRSDEKIPARSASNNSFIAIVGFTTFLLIGSIILGGWYLERKNSGASLPILTATFAAEKLSSDGNVYHAVISPDGNNVIYTSSLRYKVSVWLRQLGSGNNVEIIPPTESIYYGLAFSPDGNFVYFARKARNFEGQADIFRISVFGGVPAKIVSETQGLFGISPDGSKISFVRCNKRKDENCSLYLADSADGGNEVKLVSRPQPLRIGGNVFSPDGKSIAFAAGQSENQSNEFGLMAVDIESGRERELASEKFFEIRYLAWLPGNNGLLITASRVPNRNFRIWQISDGGGESRSLTKDTENYSNLSLNENFSLLVSTQFKSDFRLMMFSLENPALKRVVAESDTASFSPDGKILFSSGKTGNLEIWAIEPDGSRQIQLTNDPGDDNEPRVSPDNNFIFFASNRSGEAQVWRMNSDGSNQTQITKSNGGFPIFVSPDGKTVYYHHGRDRTLWSVSATGGNEQLILDKSKYAFALSADGTLVAFSEKDGENRVLNIYSIPEKKITKTFKTAIEKSRILEIQWMPDGKSVLYVLTDNAFQNHSLWSQDLTIAKPKRIVDFGDDELPESSGFAVSPDGQTFIISQGGWKHDAVLLRGLK